MNTALTLLLIQGALGAFDTLWYHEYQQRLPGRRGAAVELRLHAARDFAYALLFGSLAWLTWDGLLAWLLGAILLGEILITFWDFIEEDLHRPLPPGERVMHTIMAIVYGAFLAHLVPQLLDWSTRSSQFAWVDYGLVSRVMTLLAIGVLLSGIRDLRASWRAAQA